MSQRTDRLDSQIRAELMELLQREMKDPRIGFATITRVETARDLGSAKVWVSVLGTAEEQESAIKALDRGGPVAASPARRAADDPPHPAARHPARRLDRGGGPGAAPAPRARGGRDS